MRKIYSLLAMMVLALGIPAVAQESIQNYVERFDNLDTSNHEFAPKGWGHIVDNYSDWYGGDYYVEYSNPQTGGQDGGAYLSVGSQQLGSGWDTETVDDILVTPAVSGNVSLYVKLEKMGGSIKFYTCTKQGNSFTKGAEYSVTLPELSETEWTQVTLPSVQGGTYLGIRGENVGIDNFTADNATIVLRRELTIENVTMVSDDEIDADESGNVTLTFTVKIANTGEVDFNPDDENYSVSIVNQSQGNAVVGTQAIDFPLAAGATSDVFEVSAVMAVTENVRDRYDVMENIGGTTGFGGWVEVFPYKPDFFLSFKGEAEVLEPGTEVQFGLSQTDVTKGFRLRNNSGGAPATITEITLPEGFAYKITDKGGAEKTLPAVIPAHDELELTVTMLSEVPGSKSGDMVIKAEGYQDFVFPVSGQIVDPSKLYVNFEDNKFPVGTYVEGSSWSISDFPAEAGLESNRYCAENGLSSDEMDKLILPKVHVASGETMVFSAARRSNSSVVKVYYSSDRSDWHLVRSLSADSEAAEEDLLPDTKVGTASYDSYAFKQYTIDKIPEGDWYIAFESGYARIDDIMGYTLLEIPAADLVVDCKFPETATVNYDYKVALGIQNIGNPIEEGQLTAKFYLENNVVKEVPVPAIATRETAAVDVVYTPRKAGQFNIKVTIEGLDCTFSAENQITVAQETPVANVQVGTSTTDSQNTPLCLNYKNSETETIYTKDLIGLPAGTMIQKIIFRGYNTRETHTTHVSAWIENTTDGVFAGAPETTYSVPVEGMTQIYDGDYTFELKGESDNMVDMLVFELEEPFEYTGENLRVVVRSSADSYKMIYFDADNNVGDASIMRRTDSGVLAEQSWSLQSEMPVMTLNVEKGLTVLSGKVVSSKDQSAIEGAQVKLVSGNVEYSGVTDGEGEYSIGVYQDTKEYTVIAEKEGYFRYEGQISFPEGSTTKDISMDVATGFRLVSANVPATAMVNHAYTATVVIENGVEKAPGSYTAELYVGGEVVASDNEATLATSKNHTFTFSYTPHADGTHPAYVKLTSDYGTTQTEEVQLVIAKESAEAIVQVGEVVEVTDDAGPIESFRRFSRGEMIYTKDLIGLAEGSKIVSLQFKGYLSSKSTNIALRVWIANESGSELKGSDIAGMTQIYDGIFDTSQDFGSKNEPAVLINVAIPDGFVYTGENIRIVAESEGASGTDWLYSYFEATDVMGYAQRKSSDRVSGIDGLEEDAEWTATALPVAYFGIVPSKNVSGVVTDAETDAPIEGAEITLKSGEVEYYGTSDAEGAYSIDVVQHSLAYEMEVVAEGYEPATQAVSFDDGDIVANVELTALPEEYTYSGTVVDGETNEPVAGAVVTVLAEGGEPQTMPTGDDGGFSFTLLDGEYTVTVACEGYLEYSSELTIAGADVTGAQIALTPEVKEYTYSGTVIDGSTSAPVANAIVTVSAEGGEPQTATTGADGGFSFTLLDGEYAVTVACEDYEDGHFNVTIDGADVVGVELVITERSGISMIGVDGTVYGGNGCIFVVTESEASIYVYNTAGVLVRRAEVEAGTTRIDGIGAGVYVVNGVKVMVK